jgi:hypothetical protein
MPAISPLSREQWAEIEKAAIVGVPYPELAAKFGIEANAIKQMAWAKNWMTPARVERERQARIAQRAELSTIQIGNGENITKPNSTPTAGEIIAENIENYVTRTRNAVLRGIVPQIEGAMEDAVRFRATNNKELAAQVGMVWKVTGQDKPTVAIQMNMWNGAESLAWEDEQGQGGTIEGDPVETGEE